MTNENNENTVVYADDVMITMRGVADSIGLPYTVNPFDIVDREALIELREGPAGPVGAEGDPAWPWLWQGDIADVPALTALGLTTADARKAWRVVAANAIYYWTGMEFIAFADAFKAKGRRGAPNVLTASAVAGATGSAASAQITGTAPGQHLVLTIPRGETGDIGDPGAAGRIQDSADVLIDSTQPLGDDHILAWDAAAQKFRPVPNPRPHGPWVIGSGQFLAAQNLKEPVKVIAVLTIPAQPTAWRPWVEGVAIVSSEPTRCDVEVRIGGTDGEMVGFGWGHRVARMAFVTITPTFKDPLQPGSTQGIVPANQTITLYVLIRRTEGDGTYSVFDNYSHLQVRALPV
ncbi:hypothetical protein ACFV4K_13860 [Nocardia sp. NPDC059764]|uniref:hypothetical protein n=1 Tax=Nocardia sp. NPDC059764 TaxID=3346939 RepID=UPI003648F07C